MGFYVYILKSLKDDSFYIGHSSNLENRIDRHNAGRERYTKKKLPWKLMWSVQKESRSEAMKLEKHLKNLKSRKRIVEFIKRHGNVGPDGA